MTLEEIENTLPNGFHDAKLHSIQIDYATKTARFLITADLTDPNKEVGIAAKTVELIVSGLIFVSVDPPDPECLCDQGFYWMDGFDSSKEKDALKHEGWAASLPQGAFYNIAFVNDWNSFIHIAGVNAELRQI